MQRQLEEIQDTVEKKSVTDWQKQADVFRGWSFYKDLAKEILHKIHNATGILIDFGCHDAELLQLIRAERSDLICVGIDRRRAGLERAKSKCAESGIPCRHIKARSINLFSQKPLVTFEKEAMRDSTESIRAAVTSQNPLLLIEDSYEKLSVLHHILSTLRHMHNMICCCQINHGGGLTDETPYQISFLAMQEQYAKERRGAKKHESIADRAQDQARRMSAAHNSINEFAIKNLAEGGWLIRAERQFVVDTSEVEIHNEDYIDQLMSLVSDVDMNLVPSKGTWETEKKIILEHVLGPENPGSEIILEHSSQTNPAHAARGKLSVRILGTFAKLMKK